MSTQIREEPRIGAVDMSDVEFTLPRRRINHEDEHRFSGLWWQIALGILVGMLAHSIVTGAYVRWEISNGLKAMEAELEKFDKGMQEELRSLGPSTMRPAPARRMQSPSIRPLAHGERCVGGKRFRAVPNGWVQVQEACR